MGLPSKSHYLQGDCLMNFQINETKIDQGLDRTIPGYKVIVSENFDIVHTTEVETLDIAFEIIQRFTNLRNEYAGKLKDLSEDVIDIRVLGNYHLKKLTD